MIEDSVGKGQSNDASEREEALRAIIDGIPHIAWATAADGAMLYINAKWREYTGNDGMNIEEIRAAIHPDDLPNVTASMVRSRETGVFVPYECRLKRYDGEYRWHRVRTSRVESVGAHGPKWIGTSTDVHEEVLALESLKESEDHHSFRLRSSVQIPWLAGPDGMIYEFSDPWLELTGMTLEEATVSQVTVLHPDDAPGMIERWMQSVSTGEPFAFEHRIRVASGEWRWMRSRAVARRDESGAIIRWYGSTEDIHESRAAQEELRRTRDSFGLAMKGAKLGWWARDLITNEVVWSPELEELFGLTVGTFKGTRKEFLDFILEDDRPMFTEAVNEALGRGGDYAVEFRFRRPDGTVGWMEGRGKAVYDEDGRPIKSHGVGMDVTERRAASEAQRQSEEQFRTIAEAVPHFIWAANPEGNSIYFNPQFLEYVGITLEQLQEKGWLDFIHPEDRQQAEREWEKAYQSGVAYASEFRIQGGQENEYRWFLSRAVPLRDSDGKIVRWYGILTDVHQQKEQAALLDRLVNERTAELEAAYREQEAFSYSVSHDLRTPLRSIIASARFLQEDFKDALPEEAKLMLDEQASSALRLARLIDDLLELSRVGRQELNRERIDFSSLLQRTAHSLANPHSVHFEIQEGMQVNGDVRLLRLVAQNLLENAAKFSPNGGTVRVGFEDDCFFVADEGVGFESQYVHKLFQPFQRLHSDAEFPGTGIGLATVRRIVERHGGRIWADSEPGQGAVFYFALPD